MTHVYLDLLEEEAWRTGKGGCISLCFASMAAEALAGTLFGEGDLKSHYGRNLFLNFFGQTPTAS